MPPKNIRAEKDLEDPCQANCFISQLKKQAPWERREAITCPAPQWEFLAEPGLRPRTRHSKARACQPCHMLRAPQGCFSLNQHSSKVVFSGFIFSLTNFVDIMNLLRAGPIVKSPHCHPCLTVPGRLHKYLLTIFCLSLITVLIANLEYLHHILHWTSFYLLKNLTAILQPFYILQQFLWKTVTNKSPDCSLLEHNPFRKVGLLLKGSCPPGQSWPSKYEK